MQEALIFGLIVLVMVVIFELFWPVSSDSRCEQVDYETKNGVSLTSIKGYNPLSPETQFEMMNNFRVKSGLSPYTLAERQEILLELEVEYQKSMKEWL